MSRQLEYVRWRRELERRERFAITSEAPRYNVVHNRARVGVS